MEVTSSEYQAQDLSDKTQLMIVNSYLLLQVTRVYFLFSDPGFFRYLGPFLCLFSSVPGGCNFETFQFPYANSGSCSGCFRRTLHWLNLCQN